MSQAIEDNDFKLVDELNYKLNNLFTDYELYGLEIKKIIGE